MAMHKFFQYACLFLVATYLQGCASESVQITGNKRPAISPELVTVFDKKPDFPYEVIGKVQASNERGFSEESLTAKVKQQLKEQAAQIGANGVIINGVIEKPLQSTGTSLGLSFGSNGMIGSSIGSGFSMPKVNMTGIAIFYQDKNMPVTQNPQ